MSDTTLNIPLPVSQWVNLYAASGIAVGNKISVENVGTGDIYLTVLATEPPVGYDGYNISKRNQNFPLENTQGDSGAWAFSPNGAGKVNVREC